MLQFDNFLLEGTKKPTGKTLTAGLKANTLGVLHELMLGFYLRGGKGDPRSPKNAKFHMVKFQDDDNIPPQEAFKILSSQVSPEMFEQERKRAEFASKEMINYWKEQGYHLKDVRWTSKVGDTERVTKIPASQKQDDSDIYLYTKEGVFIGVSLKASEGTLSVPTSNPGIEATFGGEKYNDAYRKWLNRRFPHFVHLTNKEARKEWLEGHPKLAQEIKREQDKTLTKMRDNLLRHLKTMEPNQLINYLRFTIMHAYMTPAEKAGIAKHVRWSTAGKGSSFRTKVVSPGEDYEPIFQAIRENPDKFKAVLAGGTMIGFEYNGQRFATQHIKWNSGSDPLSSVKGSGTDTGAKALAHKLAAEQEVVVKKKKQAWEEEPKHDFEDSNSVPGMPDVAFHSPNELSRSRKGETRPHITQKTEAPKKSVSKGLSSIKQKIKGAFHKGTARPVSTKQEIPWDRIENDYRKTKSSVEDIGRRYGVNPASISWRAGKNRWTREARI